MNKDLVKSFLIALLYVGLGTLALLIASSSNPLVLVGILLTIPVTFIGFGITYMEGDSTFLVLIVQLLMFLITWRILYGIFRKKTTRAKRHQ